MLDGLGWTLVAGTILPPLGVLAYVFTLSNRLSRLEGQLGVGQLRDKLKRAEGEAERANERLDRLEGVKR